MPTNGQMRSWWTEACRSGHCQNCHYADEVLEIEIPNVFRLRLCAECCGQLMRELQNSGIKPHRKVK